MSRGLDDELAVLGLAVLWHDPPWKPWGIKGDRVSGYGSTVPERILNALETVSGEKSSGACVRFSRVRELYDELASGVQGDRIQSHERQALILVAAIAAAMEGRGLKEAAKAVIEAARIIAGLDGRHRMLKDADVLASALDRLLLNEALNKAGTGQGLSDGGVVLVNPFNPGYKLDSNVIPQSISAGLIAGFILEYACTLAILADMVECRGPRCLLDLAYLLLEPVWYKVTSSAGGGGLYVPPADTRIPTHTVFDHLDAALTTLLWVYQAGDSPAGCIVVVDLAGVQQWIRESRRLRDLWASSWLASLLAWKAVEALVDRYGPGVMIQPPGRLHPFYTARIIGPALDKVTTSRIGGLEWLWSAVGLPYEWPIDPVSPSRVLVAVPESECNSKLEEDIAGSYRSAWRTIIDAVIERVGDEIERQNKEIPDIIDIVRGIEPPLALRIYKVSVREAYEKAKHLAGEKNLDPEVYAKLLFYPLAVTSILPLEEAKLRLVTPGRRAGPKYYELASNLYDQGKGPELCTVCGRGIAVIDGDKVSVRAGLDRKRLMGELARDRLCPYCLVKRLLRHLITRDTGSTGGSDDIPFAKKLTSIKIRNEAAKKLMYSTVDVYTVRTRLGISAMASGIRRLIEKLDEHGSSLADLQIVLELLPRNRFLPSKEHENLAHMLEEKARGENYRDEGAKVLAEVLADKLEALVLEITHDEAFWEGYKDHVRARLSGLKNESDLKRILEFIEKHLVNDNSMKRVKRNRRKYALVAMDGDYMGKGILRGALAKAGVKCEDYAAKILNVTGDASESVKRELAGMLDTALGILAEADARCRSRSVDDDECALTVPVTPSYHMTVSRALATLAEKDRMTVEKHGGMLIYAGGDDLLAVLPGASKYTCCSGVMQEDPVVHRLLCGDCDGSSSQAQDRDDSEDRDYVRLPPLEAVVEARHRYWGDRNGFTLLQDSEGVYTIVPSLAAYGRSGVVYYVDSKRPLWIALDELRSLEDSKDQFSLATDRATLGKDVLFVASDSSGAAAIPFRMVRGEALVTYRPDKPLAILVNLMRRRKPPRVSRSIIEDYYSYKDAIHTLAYRSEHDMLYSILKTVLERNFQSARVLGRELDADTLLLEFIAPAMLEGHSHSITSSEFADMLGQIENIGAKARSLQAIKAIGLLDSVQEGCRHATILASMLLAASRIVYSSL